MDADKVNRAAQYSQSLDNFLKNIFRTENCILVAMPEWGQGFRTGAEKTEESEVNSSFLVFAVNHSLLLLKYHTVRCNFIQYPETETNAV